MSGATQKRRVLCVAMLPGLEDGDLLKKLHTRVGCLHRILVKNSGENRLMRAHQAVFLMRSSKKIVVSASTTAC